MQRGFHRLCYSFVLVVGEFWFSAKPIWGAKPMKWGKVRKWKNPFASLYGWDLHGPWILCKETPCTSSDFLLALGKTSSKSSIPIYLHQQWAIAEIHCFQKSDCLCWCATRTKNRNICERQQVLYTSDKSPF